MVVSRVVVGGGEGRLGQFTLLAVVGKCGTLAESEKIFRDAGRGKLPLTPLSLTVVTNLLAVLGQN